MQLEWLGEYRRLIGSIVRFGNAYAKNNRYEHSYNTSVKFSASEVHVMEYIMEHEDEAVNMTGIAAVVGISRAALSKNVKKMAEKGLIERYKTADNQKNIILRVTEYGKEIYRQYSQFTYETAFEQLFEKLEGIPKEYLDQFTDIMNFAAELTYKNKDPEKKIELIKID